MSQGTKKDRRGRKCTGTLEPHGDHWDVRPTLADGSRGDRVCQPKGMSEAKARNKAKALTEMAEREGRTRQVAPVIAPAAVRGPTFKAWAAPRPLQRRGYIREAETLDYLRADVFPALLAELFLPGIPPAWANLRESQWKK